MTPAEITIRVEPSLASAYRAATEDERRKIDLLLNLRLGEAIEARSSLAEVIRTVAARARQRGMNEDLLQTLLNGA